jgi:hypothetical protein
MRDALSAQPANSPADSIRDVSSVLLWTGDSGRWGLWGERELGLAVFGAVDDIPGSFRESTLADVPSALDRMSLAFTNRIVPPDFVRAFADNYRQGV